MSAASKPSRYAGTPNRPVFVGGCPRSGTTLLRTMLNSHPDLAIPHETRFLVDAYRKRRQWGDLSDKKNRRKVANWIARRPKTRVQRMHEDMALFKKRMANSPPRLGSMLSTGFVLYAERNGKQRWGDKRPSLVLNLDAVFAMYPDGQFINVVRDPRAAVASIRKIGWFEDGLTAGIELWERSQKHADRWARRLAPDQFLEIQYEHLVADPAGTLRTIVDFLNLDPAGIDDMLEYHQKVDIKSLKIHPLVDKPVTTVALRSWEEQLEREEIALIESELATQMARYGYEPIASDTPVPAELARKVRDRRRQQSRKYLRTRLGEFKLKLVYRQPVADDPKTRSTTRALAAPSSSSQNFPTNAS